MMHGVEYVITREKYKIRVRRQEEKGDIWHIVHITEGLPPAILYDCICEAFAEFSKDICNAIIYNFTDYKSVNRDAVFKRGESELDFYKKMFKYFDASRLGQ